MIGARVLRLAHDLFRAPISGRAGKRVAGRFAGRQASHAEIHQFYAIVFGDQNIGRLDVSVNYTFAVRGTQRGGYFRNPGACARHRHAAFFQDAIEWLSGQDIP